MSVVGRAHSKVVFGRRVQVLARVLSELVPSSGSVLDVGCGDGSVAAALHELRPDLSPTGVETLVRDDCCIPVEHFDGRTIPRLDDGVDFVMLVDVLHHTEDPTVLLAESARVARRAVILKDHLLQGPLAGVTLRLMDWVGNAHHGVELPYNYWPPERWDQAFERLGLRVAARTESLPLYPFPASMVFGRRLHFAARLEQEVAAGEGSGP